MDIPNSITRITDYCSRHGFTATLRRAGLQLRRILFSGRMVVFYCDLTKQTTAPPSVPSSLQLQRLQTYAELCAADVEQMTSFWNPKQVLRKIQERFEKGASLWLIRSSGLIAGYGWTLQGRTVEPYFFPLAVDDVHLFDFHVFPEFRGQGLNPVLVGHILASVAREAGGRAFIEAAEWNSAQLASLKKTPFARLGIVRTMTLFGHAFTSRRLDSSAPGTRELADMQELAKTNEGFTGARSHEQ